MQSRIQMHTRSAVPHFNFGFIMFWVIKYLCSDPFLAPMLAGRWTGSPKR